MDELELLAAKKKMITTIITASAIVIAILVAVFLRIFSVPVVSEESENTYSQGVSVFVDRVVSSISQSMTVVKALSPWTCEISHNNISGELVFGVYNNELIDATVSVNAPEAPERPEPGEMDDSALSEYHWLIEQHNIMCADIAEIATVVCEGYIDSALTVDSKERLTALLKERISNHKKDEIDVYSAQGVKLHVKISFDGDTLSLTIT